MENDQGPVKRFKCNQCDVSYSQRASLSRQRKTDHGPTLHAWCRRCDFKANRKDNLRRHYKQSHASFESELNQIQLETAKEREERKERMQSQEVRVNQVRALEDAGTWGEAAASLSRTIRRRAPATISRAPDEAMDQNRAVAGFEVKKVNPPPATAHVEPEEQEAYQVLDLTVGTGSVESPKIDTTELSLSPTRSLLAEWDFDPVVHAPAQGGKPKGMMAMVRDKEDTEGEEGTPGRAPVASRNAGTRKRGPVERIRLTKELRGNIIKIDEVSIQYEYVDGERRRASRRRRVYHVEFDEDFTYST